MDGIEEVSAAELHEVEILVGRGAPEPQCVDCPAAVTDDGSVVWRPHQDCGNVPVDFHSPFPQPERTVQPDFHTLSGPNDLPGVGTSEPVIGVLDLLASVDLLAEHPVFVPQAVA